MELMFDWQGILNRGKGLTFDDVLLVPRHSAVTSRRHPVLSSKVTKNYTLLTPIVSANMDTITEAPMAIAMANLGGMGILHRFLTPEEQVAQVKLVLADRRAHV